MGRAHRQPLSPRRTVGEVLDGRSKGSQRVMLHDLLGPLQRYDVQAKATPLEVEYLMEDERLGQTREPVHQHDEIDGSGASARAVRPSAQRRTPPDPGFREPA